MNIKIDASSIFEDERKFALIYIDLENLQFVSDVIYHIADTLHIQVQLSNQNGCELSLYDDEWYIPPGQSSSLFRSISGVLRLCFGKKRGQTESQLPNKNQFQTEIEKNETCLHDLVAQKGSYKMKSGIFAETSGNQLFTNCEQCLQDSNLCKSRNIYNSATSTLTFDKGAQRTNASQMDNLMVNEVVSVTKCISEVTSPKVIDSGTKNASDFISEEPPCKKPKKKHKKKKLRDSEIQGFSEQIKYQMVYPYNKDTKMNDNQDEIELSNLNLDAKCQKTSLEDRIIADHLNNSTELQYAENIKLFIAPVNDLSSLNSYNDPDPTTMPHVASSHDVSAEASKLYFPCIQKNPLNMEMEKSFLKCSQAHSPEIQSFSPLLQNGMNLKDVNSSSPVYPEMSIRDENNPTSPKAHIGFKGHRTKGRYFQSVGNVLNRLKESHYPMLNEGIQDSNSKAIHFTSAERIGSDDWKKNKLGKDDEILCDSTFNVASSLGETEGRPKSAMQTDQLGVEIEHVSECVSHASSPQPIDTSLKDFSDSFVPVPPNKKRKRKHAKKKKKSFDSFQKQWEFKAVDSCNKYRKKNESNYIIQPNHIVFDNSDQETNFGNTLTYDSLSNTSDSKVSEKRVVSPTIVLDSCHLNLPTDKNTKNSYTSSSYTKEIEESEESEHHSSSYLQNSPSLMSNNDHLNDHTKKLFPTCPPQPSLTFQEPSPEILSKFKRLLALEDNLEPVVFKRYPHNSLLYQEGVTSLPVAFASRKQMKYGQKLHQSFSFESSRQDIMNPNYSQNTSLYSKVSLKENEPLSLKSDTDFKGDRTRTRYSQSVGNILNVLKNHENSPGIKSATNTLVQDSDSVVIHATTKEINSNENEIKDYTFEHSETSQPLIKVESRSDNNSIKNEDCLAVKENNSPEFSAGENCVVNENKIDASDSKGVVSVNEDDYNHDITIYDLEAEIKQEEKENQEWSNISYESYPLLSSIPQSGDIIGAKLCSSDTDINSHNSTYRPAKVIASEEFKLKVQFLDVMGSNEFGKSDAYKVLDWRDLLSPRLLFP